MNCAWAATVERSRGIITLRTKETIFVEPTSRGVSKFAVFIEPVNDDRCCLSGREFCVDSISGASTLGGDGECVHVDAASWLLSNGMFLNVDD